MGLYPANNIALRGQGEVANEQANILHDTKGTTCGVLAKGFIMNLKNIEVGNVVEMPLHGHNVS
jgi:hypothetical protein